MTRLRPIFVCVIALAMTSNQAADSNKSSTKPFFSGCIDGSTEGFQDRRHPRIAACTGVWEGHIENATILCAEGWKVCGWDTEKLLKTISWKEATSIGGCYAVNAAQDDGHCRPCINDIIQDDLAGVGSGCAYKSFGFDSCITGGQIDVSCCFDSHFGRSCRYRPGLATGVLCCKQSGVPPRILIHPEKFTHVTLGGTFVLSCQAFGTPAPRITWSHNGVRMANVVSRISVFDSGYLIVSDAKQSDSGVYQCLAVNQAGKESATPSRVIVTDYSSGCADGSSDGLFNYEDIHACRGRWHGHVKKARTLCASGWQVCSPRHSGLLKMVTWTDVTQLSGCYAYNVANTLGLCTPCLSEEMAGVGKQCGSIQLSLPSCLAEGRIDVFQTRTGRNCSYNANITTGVLCCRRPEAWQQGSLWRAPKCRPRCRNGGVCVEDNRCHCAPGYKGALCQNPICPGGCITNAICVKPKLCRCKEGYSGAKCHFKESELCPDQPCLNAGRCLHGKCKCLPNFHGSHCHLDTPLGRISSDINRTEP